MLKKFKKISKGDTPTFEQLINGGWRYSHDSGRCQVWKKIVGKTNHFVYWVQHTGEIVATQKGI